MPDEEKQPEKINSADEKPLVPPQEKTGPRKILDVLDKAQEAQDAQEVQEQAVPRPSPVSESSTPLPLASEEMLIPTSMRRLENLLKSIKTKNAESSE